MFSKFNKLETKTTTRVQIFFIFILVANSIALLIQSLLPSYLRYDASASLSAVVSDEHCDIKTQSIGAHCFSDFYTPLDFVNLDNPWTNTINPYPPIANFLQKPFSILVSFMPKSHIPLGIFFTFVIIFLLIPIIYEYKLKRIGFVGSGVLLSATLSFAPIIVAIDRGNNQHFVYPLIYFFYVSFLNKNIKALFILNLIIFLIKPQMILLSIIFLILKKYKIFFVWITSSVSLFFLSFLLYPVSFPENVISYAKQIPMYNGYTNAGSINPVNLSLTNTLSTFERIALHFNNSLSSKDPLGKWDYYPSYYTIFVLAVLILLILSRATYRNDIENLFLVICLPILIPNVSFAYYLVMLLPINLMLLRTIVDKTQFDTQRTLNFNMLEKNSIIILFKKKEVFVLFLITNLLLFVPWGIPFEYSGNRNWY